MEEGPAIGIEIFGIKESKNEIKRGSERWKNIGGKERKEKKLSPAVIPGRMITP